jgi:hypothetical protein
MAEFFYSAGGIKSLGNLPSVGGGSSVKLLGDKS